MENIFGSMRLSVHDKEEGMWKNLACRLREPGWA